MNTTVATARLEIFVPRSDEALCSLVEDWLACWVRPRAQRDFMSPPVVWPVGEVLGASVLFGDPSSIPNAAVSTPPSLFEVDRPEGPERWLVSLDGAAPATALREETPELVRFVVRVDARVAFEGSFLYRLEAPLVLLGFAAPTLELLVEPPTLLDPIRLVNPRRVADAVGALFYQPELVEMVDGAWVSPHHRPMALLALKAGEAVEVELETTATLSAEHQEIWEDIRQEHRALRSSLRPDGSLRMRPMGIWQSFLPGGPLSACRRIVEADEVDVLVTAGLVGEDGRVEREQGPLSRVLPWFSAQLKVGRWAEGAIGLGFWERSVSSQAKGAEVVPGPDAALFLGPSRLQSLVSERLLRHGPWALTWMAGGGVLLQLVHARAPRRAAVTQRDVAHPWLLGLLVPPTPQLPSDLAEYDPDTRSVLVRPRHVPDLFRKLAHIIGWSRAHADDPRQPVERVLAPIPDPALARLWLPVLWLREIAVWTILDGQWTRIDQGYQPSWGPPGWCAWDAEEPGEKG